MLLLFTVSKFLSPSRRLRDPRILQLIVITVSLSIIIALSTAFTDFDRKYRNSSFFPETLHLLLNPHLPSTCVYNQ